MQAMQSLLLQKFKERWTIVELGGIVRIVSIFQLQLPSLSLLVVASMAKHGNRLDLFKSGSADVLELGLT